MSNSADTSDSVGYCLTCAREAGIKPVTDIMDKMGISEEDIDMMQNQMGELMESGMIPENFDEMMADTEDGMEENEDEDFSRGGAPAFPPFFKNLFSGASRGDSKQKSEKEEKNKKDDKAAKKRKRKHLEAYCTDLTGRAANGQLDKIVGRDKELDRVIQILSRRTKNNPCLIGEPGVGKTAIAEGLALKIVSGDVPLRLQKKEIHLLDLTALVAGTQFRGQFESRIKGLIEEVKADGNIILFIDEVHSLVGTGESEGAMNAANFMKPALSRGEIQKKKRRIVIKKY